MEPVWENFIVTPEQEELVNQIQSIGSELGGA